MGESLHFSPPFGSHFLVPSEGRRALKTHTFRSRASADRWREPYVWRESSSGPYGGAHAGRRSGSGGVRRVPSEGLEQAGEGHDHSGKRGDDPHPVRATTVGRQAEHDRNPDNPDCVCGPMKMGGKK